MSGPWERYAAQEPPDTGPWSKYASGSSAKPQSSAPQLSTLDRIAEGLADQFHGGAQVLENAVRGVSPGAVESINRLNNWLADYGIVGRLPAGGVNQAVKERERALKTDGMDWWRLAGNMFSPANLALAGAPAAATTAGRIAAGGGLGALTAGLMPSESGASGRKLEQMALGGAFGAAVPAVAAGVGKLISPRASTNPQIAALRAEGVEPTIGQTLGGTANKVEERAMSLPFVGDSIGRARVRANDQLNAAVGNRALAPIGQKAPAGVTGRDLVGHVRGQLQQAYDDVLPSLTTRADQAFNSDINNLRQMVRTGSIDPNAARAFDRVLQNDLLGKFRGQQALTGQTIKQVESDLGQKIARFGASTDADSRLVADALREAQDSLRRLLQRTNPEKASELAKINQGWAAFKRLERAASYVGAEDGAFSPAHLQQAVRALDRSKDHGAFARGAAPMQNLSDAAKTVLGSKVPNSGTADRVLNAGLLGAGAVVDPVFTGAGLLAGMGAYTPQGQGLLRALVSSRPQSAQAVAGLLNDAAPVLVPAGGLLGLQLAQ